MPRRRIGDVVAEVGEELRESIAAAIGAGVPRERLIVDPGVGFAKRPSHSYGVLARLPELAAALDRPLLVGPSRKSFMREALDGRPAPERDWGTAAAVTAAVLAGAHIVRVHAVAEMVQVVARGGGEYEKPRARIIRSPEAMVLTCCCASARRSAGGISSTSSWCRS